MDDEEIALGTEKLGDPVPEPDKIQPISPPQSSETQKSDENKNAIPDSATPPLLDADFAAVAEENGRERLKRHRVEAAGRVWIPDIWGQEEFLKDWIDCSAFDASLVPSGIVSARAALAREGRRANSGGFRIENRC